MFDFPTRAVQARALAVMSRLGSALAAELVAEKGFEARGFGALGGGSGEGFGQNLGKTRGKAG